MTTPAKPFVGNWEVPFVTRGEFIIPCTRGFAARAGIIPFLHLSMMGLAQSLPKLQSLPVIEYSGKLHAADHYNPKQSAVIQLHFHCKGLQCA